MFKKILKGYSWFRENNLIHRDLKLQNIFMKGEKPILSDFGTVRALHEELRVNKDPDEMSPRPFTRTILSSEQVRDEPYGVPVDIWDLV